jgi:hypothetical protein
MNIKSIAFPTFFIAILLCLYYYDRIVKTEYSNYHDQWLGDGSPPGFFWWPKGTRIFSGSARRGNLSFQWLFSSPKWTLNDKRVRRYFLKLRISWGVGFVAWLILMSSLIG